MAERYSYLNGPAYDTRGILRRHCLLTAPSSLNSSIQEVGDASVTVQLTCPISLRRQVLPVRTSKCSHAQTFDLLSTPEAQRNGNFYNGKFLRGRDGEIVKCPICLAGGVVYIDREIRHYLQLHPNWLAITVSQTGIISEKVERAEEQSFIDLISPVAPRTPPKRNIFTFPELNERRRTSEERVVDLEYIISRVERLRQTVESTQWPDPGRCVPRPPTSCSNHHRRPRLSTIDLLSP